ncbi:MAG: glycoside hydrolase family 88 protein [Fibrobacter sp.]|nr:glycoside hydrolase family 88 protein [Fibrobacter sp.]
MILTCVVLLFSAVSALEIKLPQREQILVKMKAANDYFMDKWPDPCSSCLVGNRPSNIWTRAVYYEGSLAYYAASHDSAALNHALRWGEFHSWNLRGGTMTTNADNQCAGQVYIDLYRINQQPERISSIKTCIDRMVASGADNRWTWIDAIQMAMPVFAKLGALLNDTRYFDKMYRLYDYSKSDLGLYNESDHLWWRDASFVNAKTPSGKNVYWSRGNGWVFAALVRVLSELPDSDPHRQEYETVFKEMAGALAALQRDDGFWNENLADPEHFGGPEVTGTGLFVYGMAWGVNKRMLSRDEYLPVIIKAWSAIADSAIFPDGRLGYVQGTGDSPGDNGAGVTDAAPSRDIVPDFDDYGLGCVLLAGSEMVKLVDTPTIANKTLFHTVSKQLPASKITGTLFCRKFTEDHEPTRFFTLSGKLLETAPSGTENIKKKGAAKGVFLEKRP